MTEVANPYRRAKQIETAVLAVLGNAECAGDQLRLTGKLDRKLYLQTNDVLEAAGGKWDKRAKAHIFAGDAAEAIESLVLTGQYTKVRDLRAEFGFFETPAALAQSVVVRADIRDGHTVLEPSAGLGAIARALRMECPSLRVLVEFEPGRAEALAIAFPTWTVICADFLALTPGEGLPPRFDRIVMNPPFAKRADIHHITKAASLLAPDGRLVAIASASVLFRTDRLAVDFRNLVAAHNGHIEELPPGSFAESGTGVNAVVVTMNR